MRLIESTVRVLLLPMHTVPCACVRFTNSVVTRQAAIRLYQSIGFRIYGTEQEPFSKDGQFYDEHLMTLELTSIAPIRRSNCL